MKEEETGRDGTPYEGSRMKPQIVIDKGVDEVNLN